VPPNALPRDGVSAHKAESRAWVARPRAWNNGGVDALLQYLDANVDWHPPRESMEPGIYCGREGVRDYLGQLGEIAENAHLEPLAVIDVDNERVISVVCVMARSEHSAVEINADWAWLITVGRDRKGLRVETFTDKAQALTAVGLAE
jgi:ketosteroid isomerase-like protein